MLNSEGHKDRSVAGLFFKDRLPSVENNVYILVDTIQTNQGRKMGAEERDKEPHGGSIFHILESVPQRHLQNDSSNI